MSCKWWSCLQDSVDTSFFQWHCSDNTFQSLRRRVDGLWFHLRYNKYRLPIRFPCRLDIYSCHFLHTHGNSWLSLYEEHGRSLFWRQSSRLDWLWYPMLQEPFLQLVHRLVLHCKVRKPSILVSSHRRIPESTVKNGGLVNETKTFVCKTLSIKNELTWNAQKLSILSMVICLAADFP